MPNFVMISLMKSSTAIMTIDATFEFASKLYLCSDSLG